MSDQSQLMSIKEKMMKKIEKWMAASTVEAKKRIFEQLMENTVCYDGLHILVVLTICSAGQPISSQKTTSSTSPG
jgi:hypothetical protein